MIVETRKWTRINVSDVTCHGISNPTFARPFDQTSSTMSKRLLGTRDILTETISISLLCTEKDDSVVAKRPRLLPGHDSESLPNISTVGPHRPEPTSSDEPHGPLITYLIKQGIVFLSNSWSSFT
jgi:hypothetical protein